MIKLLKKLFKSENTNKVSLEEVYLSQATSLEDVERRQNNIARGQAPWQLTGRGW